MKDWRSADLTPRQRAIGSYAAALTQDPGHRSREDIESLRAHGLDDIAILDLAHVIGFFAYANRLVDGLGCLPEPEW